MGNGRSIEGGGGEDIRGKGRGECYDNIWLAKCSGGGGGEGDYGKGGQISTISYPYMHSSFSGVH